MDFKEQQEKFLKHEYNKNVSYHYIECLEEASSMEELVAVVVSQKRKVKGSPELAAAYINEAIA